MNQKAFPKARDVLKRDYGVDFRKLTRGTLAVMLGAGLAVSMTASADWAVNDSEAISKLKDIDKKLGNEDQSVNGRLQSLRAISSFDYETGSEGTKNGKFKAPPLPIAENENGNGQGQDAKPTWDKPAAADVTDEQRCAKPRSLASIGSEAASDTSASTQVDTSTIPGKQWKVCTEIVQTQKAQYKYNLMMSDLISKRYELLTDIQQERNQLGENDAGKLESNTNRLTALLALIQIDQQQRQAYNDAYAARLTYLGGLQERLSQMAIQGNGKTGAKQVAGDVAEWAVMAGALGVDPKELPVVKKL